MKLNNLLRSTIAIMLSLVLTIGTSTFVKETQAGSAYTIKVGETVNITFRYPGTITQQWWGIDRSIANIISSDQDVNTITVVGVSPGETSVKTQVTYPQQSYAYGETFTITQWTQDTSIIRVLPADGSGSNAGNATSSDTTYDKLLFDHMYDGMIAAVKDGKMGFLDKDYKVVIPFQYYYDPTWNIKEYYDPKEQSSILRLWQFNQGIALVYKPTGLSADVFKFANVFIDKTGKELELGDAYKYYNFSNNAYTDGRYVYLGQMGQLSPTNVNTVFDLKTGEVQSNVSYDNGSLSKYGRFWEKVSTAGSPLPDPASATSWTSTVTNKTTAQNSNTTSNVSVDTRTYTIGVGEAITFFSPFKNEGAYGWIADNQDIVNLTVKKTQDGSTCIVKGMKAGKVVLGHAAVTTGKPNKTTTFTVIVK